jgi:hypothetical protein
VMLEANSYGAYERFVATQADLHKNQRPPFPGAPALTPNAVKALLQYSATPLHDANGAQYDALTQGSGEVNGLGALLLSYSVDTKQPAGTFWMTSAWPASTPFGGVDEPWSQSLIWGTRMVQGSSLVDFNQAAWGENLVWGTGEMDNLVWGTFRGDDDNLVWGTFFGDDDNLVWGTNVVTDVSWSGNASFGDNLVWGTMIDWHDHIVWGTNLIGMFDGDNLVWGTFFGGSENLVWGTLDDDNLVWGTSQNKVNVLGTTGGGEL